MRDVVYSNLSGCAAAIGGAIGGPALAMAVADGKPWLIAVWSLWLIVWCAVAWRLWKRGRGH
jgi:hypothetical protein